MSLDSTTASVPPVQATPRGPGHRSTVLALLAAVIVVDQLAKWWAWRHASLTQINYGGNILVGATVSQWYAHPLLGALLDLVDFGLLSTAALVLIRRRPPAFVLVPGAVMVGGWISNLLDRLGMHYWTAPGSVRGAVDFIPLGSIRYNVADVFIVGGTLLFILAVPASAWLTSRTVARPMPTRNQRRRARAWLPVVASAACLVVAVGFGAVNYGGVTTPSASPRTATRTPG
jgi:lipoprotein signal peptidase